MNTTLLKTAMGLALAWAVGANAEAPASFHYKLPLAGIGGAQAASEQPAPLSPLGAGTDSFGACANGLATGCTSYSDGSLVKYITDGDLGSARSAICKSTGKWYMEMTYTPRSMTTNTRNATVGVSTALTGRPWSTGFPKYSALHYIHLANHFILVTDDVGTAVPTQGLPLHQTTAVLGIALDADARQVSFILDGATKTVQLAAPAGSCFYFEAATFAAYGTFNGDVNFGQADFNYIVPAGYNRGWW